jgi:rubrerythrin
MGTKQHRRARGRAFSEDGETVQDVEVQVERPTEAASAPSPLLPEDSGFVDYRVAGTEVSGEFRCSDCGYGAVVQRALPLCPMCGGTVWETRFPRFPR